MRRTLLLAAAALTLLASAPAAAQQPSEAPAAAPATGELTAPAPDVVVPAAPVAAGLPERVAPPRTLRSYWHVFIAFALAWVLLFGYAVSLGQRLGRVDREVQRLRGAAD